MKRYRYITPEDFETAKQNGISETTLVTRVRKLGWDIEKAIKTPLQRDYKRWDKWCKIAESNGINRRLFNQRIHTNGLEPSEAAMLPKGYVGNRKFSLEIMQLAERNGISKDAFYARVNRGWSQERAATVPIIEKYSHKAATK